jgi:hypothetical protein
LENQLWFWFVCVSTVGGEGVGVADVDFLFSCGSLTNCTIADEARKQWIKLDVFVASGGFCWQLNLERRGKKRMDFCWILRP